MKNANRWNDVVRIYPWKQRFYLTLFFTIAILFSTSQVLFSICAQQLRPAQVTQSDVKKPEQVTPLALGRVITRDLMGDQSHKYQLSVTAGEFFRVKAQQLGIDLVLMLSDPAGKKLVEVDRPNGSDGPEELFWITQQTGTLQIEVKALSAKSAIGKYEIQLMERRSATARDQYTLSAQALVNEGNDLRAQGKEDALREASVKFEQAVKQWQEVGDQENEAYARVVLAFARSESGERRKSVDSYQKALPLFRALGNQEMESAALHNIGSDLDELGERQKALEYYDQALKLRRKQGDKRNEASTLHNIGYSWGGLGEHRKALEYYEQALKIRREIGEQNTEAVTLHNIGYTWSELGEHRKALEYYEQTLKLRRKIGDQSGEAITLRNIGYNWAELGERRKALQYYEQEIALRQELKDRAGEADALIEIGFNWAALGEKRKALKYHEQALTISNEIRDEGRKARALHEMGVVYFDLGEKTQALKYLQEALAEHQKRQDRKGEQATMLYYIGRIFYGQGEMKKALAYYEQVLSLVRAINDKSGEGTILETMGYANYSIGDKKKSLELFEQYLSLVREMGNKAGEAGAFDNIGWWYSLQDDSKKALPYYERALPLYRAVKDWEGEKRILSNIGEVYDGLGEKKKALEYYQQALAVVRINDESKVLDLLETMVDVAESAGEAQKVREFQGEIRALRNSKTLQLWNPDTRKSLPVRFAGQSDTTALAYSPNGKQIASASSDRVVRIWDVQTGKLLRELRSHTQSVEAIVFSPDSQRLYSGSWDKTVCVWDTSSGKLLQTYAGHSGAVQAVALSPDGKRLASAGADQIIRLTDTRNGESSLTLTGHSAAVNTVAFSPDGRRLASGGSDGKILLWDVEKGSLLRTLTGHDGGVNSVAFSPDSRSLASGGDDQTVRTWNLADPSEAGKVICSHAAPVRSVAYQVDGKYVASGGYDRIVRLSNAAQSFQILESPLKVTAICYSTDGTTLATAGQVEAPPKLHLLSIGIGKYLDKTFLRLEGPQNDVQGLKDVLEARSGFSRVDSHILLDEKATKAGILKAFEDLGRSVSPADTVIVTYSGHGVQTGGANDKSFTLPAYNYDVSRNENGISARLLQSLLSKVEARRKFIVLDAAHSSLGFQVLSSGVTKEQQEFGELFQQNIAILSTDGQAMEFVGAGGKYYGELSGALIEALNGQADANSDGQVTAKEAIEYVIAENRKRRPGQPIQKIQTGSDFRLTSVIPRLVVPLMKRKEEDNEDEELQVQFDQLRHVGKSYVESDPAFDDFGFVGLFRRYRNPLWAGAYFQQPQQRQQPPPTQEPPKPSLDPSGPKQKGSELVGDVRQSLDQYQLKKGKDYALFIATDSYESYEKLNNPIHDAETIAQELKESYGFEIDSTTDILRNPKKSDIKQALTRLIKKKDFADGDQLFIFISGHGRFFEDLKEGYIIASDSKAPTDDELGDTCLSHTQLRKWIDLIPCKHIFLVIDACFSGTFDERVAMKGVNDPDYAEADNFAFISRKMAFRTRRYLTSGGKEYVPDGRPGAHSPFARKLIEALRTYGGKYGVLTINGVLSHIERVVPEPMRGEFGGNEPGSDFVFMAKIRLK